MLEVEIMDWWLWFLLAGIVATIGVILSVKK